MTDNMAQMRRSPIVNEVNGEVKPRTIFSTVVREIGVSLEIGGWLKDKKYNLLLRVRSPFSCCPTAKVEVPESWFSTKLTILINCLFLAIPEILRVFPDSQFRIVIVIP